MAGRRTSATARSEPSSGPGVSDDIGVGRRIRELRLARGTTLTELARAASLSAGGLSQIESGTIQPSLTTLRRVAVALDEPIFRFFVSPDIDPDIVVRAASRRKVIGAAGTIYELLTPSLRGSLEVIEMRLSPGDVSAEAKLGHPGEECMIVIQGQARLELGEMVYELNVGDAATYQGQVPHRIFSTGEVDLVALSAITPPSF